MKERKESGTSIFDFQDYRAYLRARMEGAPRQRGQMTRISEAANVHKTTLSQIFHGAKDFSLEQACRVARFFSLSSEETEFFLLQVNYARAGSADLKELFRQQMETRRRQREQLQNRVSRSRDLSSEERAIYYSNWVYAAVRNLSAIEGFQQPAAIARKLGLPPTHISQVLEFLLRTGLCAKSGGKIQPGPQMTHLEAGSPLVARHHGNWRVKAMERHPLLDAGTELAYTAPMTLSEADVHRIRALIADLVEKTDEIVGPSPSERLYCMCIDWFEVK